MKPTKQPTKWTPGPWTLFPESTCIFGPDKLLVADTAPSENHISYRDSKANKANARLVAHAPELAALVKRLDAIIKRGGDLQLGHKGSEHDLPEQVRAILAAIKEGK